jgi:seryl-tRNA synthetase
MSARTTVTVPPGLGDDACHELARHLAWSLPDVTSCGFDGQAKVLWFVSGQPLDQTGLKQAANERGKAMNTFPSRRLASFEQHPLPAYDKVEDLLRARGDLRSIGPNTVALRGSAALLAARLEQLMKREAAELGAEEWLLPSLMYTGDLARSGYLRDFPHQANLVCHLPGQPDEVKQAAAQVISGSEVPSHLTSALAPTVCYRMFTALADSVVEPDLFVQTASAKCFRHEGAAASGLDRLGEFSMREVVAIGQPQAVSAFRDTLLELSGRLLEKTRLHAWIESASDPFFTDVWEKGRLFQMGFDLKAELRVRVAGRDESLAIGSVNHHRDHFGLAFNIRDTAGHPVHSCCVGFGIERWILAVLSHHGPEPDGWPQTLQQA